ncbi:MAG TPA: hypothetical protein VKD22_07600 [Ramlibacter sp.]|nr:hypothetical protein [Ramlibacter sp.]
MADFFRTSTVWVIEFTFDGRPRRWLKALPQAADARSEMEVRLAELYGPRARIIAVRPATPEEETQYIRGELPKNMMCPTGRAPPRRP